MCARCSTTPWFVATAALAALLAAACLQEERRARRAADTHAHADRAPRAPVRGAVGPRSAVLRRGVRNPRLGHPATAGYRRRSDRPRLAVDMVARGTRAGHARSRRQLPLYGGRPGRPLVPPLPLRSRMGQHEQRRRPARERHSRGRRIPGRRGFTEGDPSAAGWSWGTAPDPACDLSRLFLLGTANALPWLGFEG